MDDVNILKVTVLIFQFITATVKVRGIADCGGEGWIQNEEHCYYIGTVETDNNLFAWYQARDWCLQRGSDLASFDNQEEIDFIFNATTTGTFVGNVWIGLNKFNGDRKEFGWVDGSTSEFRSWAYDQPLESNLGMCVRQLTHNLKNCIGRLQGISTIAGLFNSPSDTVPGERFYFGYFFGGDAAAWIECEKRCLAEPGCNSYTYISTSHTSSIWRGECMGSNDAQKIRVPDSTGMSGERILCDELHPGRWFTANCAERNGFVCKRAVGASGQPIIPPTTSPHPGYCPSGYFEGQGGKCYSIIEKGHNEGLVWSDAVSICRAGPGINPDIASIHSLADSAVIAMNLPDFTRGLWIGLEMQTVNSPWTWADNSPVDFFNWATTPASGRVLCGELWAEPGQHASWNAVVCTTKSGYICQTYKDGTVLTPPVTLPHSCPQHYINYGNVCYRLIPEPLTWDQAAARCGADGAGVVSIHSEQENAALLLIARSIAPFWIGFKMDEDYQWHWTDGWPILYTGWESGKEPEGQAACAVYQNNSEWKNEDCDQIFASVCRISSTPPPTTPPTLDGYCPDNWIGRGSHCYFFSTSGDGLKSWELAERDCTSRAEIFLGEGGGGGLVSIHSRDENEFVFEEGKSRSIGQMWIGLHKTGHETPHRWTDGTSLDYTRWAPGEPNDKNGSQLCNEMYITLFPGLWNDHICAELRNYVCKAPKGSAPPTPPYSPPGLSCPEGCRWKSRGQFCYYIDLTSRLTFLEAQHQCVKLGGHTARLAHISDLATNLFLVESIKQDSSSSGRIWIGLTQKRTGEAFRWMDGSVANFSNWDVGEPNNQGEENCAEIVIPSGLWNDMNCATNRLAFICQVSKEALGIPSSSHGSDGGSQGDAAYALSHGQMAGVVIGAIVCTIIVAALIIAIYGLITGYRPDALDKITQQRYPKVKRKSTVEKSNSRNAAS